MSEFRQDIVSKHWVLFAPNRATRPEDFKVIAANPDLTKFSAKEKTCPFCAGNEAYNLEIASYPKGRDWQVRVIPNKYEALGHSGSKPRHDFYIVREGIGDHEVIVSRPHNVPMAFLPDDLMDLNLKVYQDRMLTLAQHPDVQYVHVLQNYGFMGGASILHPHSQIFGTPFVPEHVHDEVTGSYHYFQTHGACIYCEMILKEMQEQVRIILDQKDFLVLAPFASRVPYSIRIISKTHRASFAEMTASERKSLGQVLKWCLQRIYHKLHNASYNFYIHTLPISHTLRSRYDARSYHWHLEVLPRLNVWGGFELGSDVYVNTVLPETAADVYRQPDQ